MRRRKKKKSSGFVNISKEELRRLRTVEKRYRILFDDNLISVVISNSRGRIYEANDAYLKLTGWTREDVEAGRANWPDISPLECSELEINAKKEARRYGRCKPFEKAYIRKDGVRVPILVVHSAFKSDRFNTFIVDLTEQKKIEAELKEAIRCREDFLSIASHELKTPLTSLQLQLQLLSRLRHSGGVSPENVDAKLDGVQMQVKRLNTLIDSLLDVTRIRANRISFYPVPLELRSVLEEVVARFRDEANTRNVSLTLEPGPRINGSWDRTRIEQIISNLISNALKYGASKPVKISLQKKNRKAVLQVSDQGIGIAECDQARIFDRFERAVPHNYGGLGLGLYITRKFVEFQGGRMWVDSRLGKGSTFGIEWPLDRQRDLIRNERLSQVGGSLGLIDANVVDQ